MATATIDMQDNRVLTIKQQATEAAAVGKRMQIQDAAEYGAACNFLKGVVSLRKQVAETFDPIIQAAHLAHKTAIDKKKEIDTPLAEAELHLKRCVAGFQQEQERLRRAEEDRLRKQLAEEAAAASKREAEDAQLEMAIDFEQQGDAAAAEAVLNSPTPTLPAFVPPVILPSTVEKQDGISRKQNWKARVVDESKVPREFLMVDLQKLNAYAKAMKGAARVAGVEFYDDGSIAVKV